MSRDITIASTTDTPEEVKRVAALDAPKPETPPEEEVKTETEETPVKEEVESEPATEAKTEGEETPGKPKGKGGFQRRIDKLTKRNYQLEEELESQKERTERLLAQLETGAKVQAPTSTDDPEPQLRQFEGKSYEDYVKALARWTARQENKSQAQVEAKKSEEARTQEVFKSYNQRLSEARGRYEDYDEVVGQDISIPQSAKVAIIELENGPDIAYYLGQHPEVCEDLLELSDVQAVAHIGAISSALRPAEGEKESPKTVGTLAPPPIKPVAGASTKSTVPLDELPYREYRAIRDRQTKGRYT